MKKVFVTGSDQEKDKLIMVVRAPFRTSGFGEEEEEEEEEGNTVVLLEGQKFRSLFTNLLDPICQLCLSTATTNDLMLHLEVGQGLAESLKTQIMNLSGSHVKSFESFKRPKGADNRKWDKSLKDLQDNIASGFFYF